MEKVSNIDDRRIIFYDGGCGVCNSFVQLVLDKRKKTFYFSAIQSDFAQKFLKEQGEKVDMTTLYFWDRGKLYDRSGAVMRIAKGMKIPYPIIYYMGFVFPKPVRDYLYTVFAKNRGKIKSSHRVDPEKEGREYFIDYEK
ncbi:MAG: DUF393 domain-containing protein [Brumimicrobium sp.]|nr:DUF393 domain-containing protein [Brumimicrobium sp.]